MNDPTNVKVNGSLNGYAAHPKGNGPFAGVLVFMEAYGITGHIQGVCERLAQAGFTALAPDFFGYPDLTVGCPALGVEAQSRVRVGTGMVLLLVQQPPRVGFRRRGQMPETMLMRKR